MCCMLEDVFSKPMTIWTVHSKNNQHTKLQQAAHHSAAQFHPTKKPPHWAASCVSTRCSHIQRPSCTNGVFVGHFLTTAHRQECLRGKQQRLAGAPALLLASCPSGAGTKPGASYWCQVGHRSSEGSLAAAREAIENDYRPTRLQPLSVMKWDIWPTYDNECLFQLHMITISSN